MQSESVSFPVVSDQAPIEDELADFSTNRRVMLLSAMSLVIGAFSALVASVLLWLIAAITNLAFYHRFSTTPALPQGNHLGYWVVLVPVVGALVGWLWLSETLGGVQLAGAAVVLAAIALAQTAR